MACASVFAGKLKFPFTLAICTYNAKSVDSQQTLSQMCIGLKRWNLIQLPFHFLHPLIFEC